MPHSNTEQLKRFRRMGLVFLALALFFSLGAYLFPTAIQSELPHWFSLSESEKESFYMVSLIFVAAGIYCIK